MTSSPALTAALSNLALVIPREMAVAVRADQLAGTVLHPLDSDYLGSDSGEPELDLFNRAIDGSIESEARGALALRRLGRLVALAAQAGDTAPLAKALGVEADDLDSLLECANWVKA